MAKTNRSQDSGDVSDAGAERYPDGEVAELTSAYREGRLDRRAFLTRLGSLGVASTLAYQLLRAPAAAARQPQPTTLAVGEEDLATTQAVGEEEPTTDAIGEEQFATTQAVGEEDLATTEAVGEEEPTTDAVGEEDGTTQAVGEEDPTTLAVGEEEARPTTLAIGEEEPTTERLGEEDPTTERLGEEDPTTQAVGEEDPTTLAVGEEDPTTLAVGEEDPTTLAVGEEDAPGGGGVAPGRPTPPRLAFTGTEATLGMAGTGLIAAGAAALGVRRRLADRAESSGPDDSRAGSADIATEDDG